MIPASAVLVDLDGTLLDTAPDLARAVNAMLDEMGRDRLAESAVRDFLGHGIGVLVARSLEASLGRAPDDRLLREAGATFDAIYARSSGEAAPVFPGVADGLARMRASGLRIACVTNKPARFTRPLLAASNLLNYLDLVVTPDESGARKPDPGSFLHACRGLGKTPSQAVVIGDSMSDSMGARAACIPFWLVPYGYREGMPVEAIPCDGIVASLVDAARRLES